MATRESINAAINRIFARVRVKDILGASSDDATSVVEQRPMDDHVVLYAVRNQDKKRREPSYDRKETYRVRSRTTGRTVCFELSCNFEPVKPLNISRYYLRDDEIKWLNEYLKTAKLFDNPPLGAYHEAMMLALGRELNREEKRIMAELNQQQRLVGQINHPHEVRRTDQYPMIKRYKFWEVKP